MEEKKDISYEDRDSAHRIAGAIISVIEAEIHYHRGEKSVKDANFWRDELRRILAEELSKLKRR